MPLYEYKCEDCNHTQDLFYNMNDKRPTHVDCNKCKGKAIRIYSIGAAYLKKVCVGDIWDKAGVDPQKANPTKLKEANEARVKKLKEQNRINIDRQK